LAHFCGSARAGEAADVSLATEVENYLAAAAPEGDANTFRAFWKDGPRFETADGNFTLALLGRLMWDSFWITSDDFDSTITEDGTFFRRVRLGVRGTAYKNTEFMVEVDFARGSVVLTDVYVALKKLGFAGTFKAGHFKEPIGLEVLASANDITFMERSAATEAFAPFRNAGFSIGNAALEERMTWAVGMFKDGTDDLGATREDGGYALTARVTGLVVQNKDAATLVHVGVGFRFADPNGDAVQFQARPGTGTGNRLVNTGSIAADDYTLVNFEFAVVWKRLSAQAEFYLADVGAVTGADPSFSGWYVQVSWWITGETRPYKAAAACFGAPKPKRNFHDGGGGPGAWEIAVRIDTIDLIDEGVDGGEQDDITAGVNWHWNPNARVMFNVVFSDVTGGPNDGELTVFEMRFQFHF
jgi:phosphate-selective porin OprO/OprP